MVLWQPRKGTGGPEEPFHLSGIKTLTEFFKWYGFISPPEKGNLNWEKEIVVKFDKIMKQMICSVLRNMKKR